MARRPVPIHLSLAYNDDPFIKGISNNPDGARQFLKKARHPAADH